MWEGGWRRKVSEYERELPSDISHIGNEAFRCLNRSQPQNSHVLVSFLSFLTSFCANLKWQRVLWVMISFSSHTLMPSTHPLPSLGPPLSSLSLSRVLMC